MSQPPINPDDGGDITNYDDAMRAVFHQVPVQKREIRKMIWNKPLLSSTTLQMFLYYNVFYSLAYAWFFVLAFRWKYLNHTGLRVQFFTPIFFSLWCICEVYRLYVGYQGNLKEDTPNMAAFLFLTIFPQLIFTIYFLAMQFPLYGFDRIFSSLHLAFLILEFFLAWRCLGVFIRDKTARFAVEYGGVESPNTLPSSEVVALNRFIDEDEIGPEEILDEMEGEDDGMGLSRRASMRRQASLARGATLQQQQQPLVDDDLITPRSRDGTLTGGTLSFGGPQSTPIARQATYEARASASMPRGSGARGSGAPAANTAASSTSPFTRGPSMRGTVLQPLPPLSSTSRIRENETPEERLARRQRDRAIISGQLIPARRDVHDEDADEIEAERERLNAQHAATLDRLSTSRPPALANLQSTQTVRVPTRSELSASGTTSDVKNE